MKGMLYSSLLANRSNIIGAAIYSAAAAVVGIILIFVSWEFPGYSPTLQMPINLFPIISVSIAVHGIGRETENNLKSRFTGYALTAVTPHKFAAAHLAENLALTFYGTALGTAVLLTLYLADDGMVNEKLFALLPLFGVLCTVYDRGQTLLTIDIKSAEKANMIIVLPLTAIAVAFAFVGMKNQWLTGIEDLADNILAPTTVIIFIAAAAALHVLFFNLLVNRIKRGNIC